MAGPSLDPEQSEGLPLAECASDLKELAEGNGCPFIPIPSTESIPVAVCQGPDSNRPTNFWGLLLALFFLNARALCGLYLAPRDIYARFMLVFGPWPHCACCRLWRIFQQFRRKFGKHHPHANCNLHQPYVGHDRLGVDNLDRQRNGFHHHYGHPGWRNSGPNDLCKQLSGHGGGSGFATDNRRAVIGDCPQRVSQQRLGYDDQLASDESSAHNFHGCAGSRTGRGSLSGD
jgi:hypothetical protein